MAEASGGWGPAALKVFQELGQMLGAKSGEGAAAATEQLFQSLSVTLQRENARAVIRRVCSDAGSAPTLPDP